MKENGHTHTNENSIDDTLLNRHWKPLVAVKYAYILPLLCSILPEIIYGIMYGDTIDHS